MLSRTALLGLALYIFAAVSLALGLLPPVAAAALAAPYVLLVPVGVGLCACFGWRASVPPGIGRVQALLVAWFVGALLVIFAFVLLERHGLTGRFADLALAFFCVLAAAGLLRLRRAFELDLAAVRRVRLVALVALPAILLQYAAEIPVYSDFPVLDLFQRTHFHKGALEFAKYSVLNPFVADSYVPFQQLLLGLLARGAGVDPLVAEWTLPLAMTPLQVGAIYAVAVRITRSDAQLALAAGLFLAMSSVTNPTNGQLAAFGALLLFSLLPNPVSEDVKLRDQVIAVFFILVAIAAGIALGRLPVVAGFAAFAAVVGLASMPHANAAIARTAIIVLVVITVLPFHRAAMLFLPLVLLIQLILTLFFPLCVKKGAKLPAGILLGLSVLTLGMAGHIILRGGLQPEDEFGLWPLFDYALKPLAGKSMAYAKVDYDLAAGAGGRIALFEVARLFSCFCALVAAMLCCRVILSRATASRQSADLASGEASGVALLAVCLLVIAVTLTGFPFAHRGAFLVAALLAIATAMLLLTPAFDTQRRSPVAIAAIAVLLVYAGFLLTFASPVQLRRAEPFFERVAPLLALLLCSGLALFLWYLWKKSSIHLALALVAAVLFETNISRAYFKPYAFSNQTPPLNAAFSHFGHQELATADAIASKLTADTVLVSDPKTMALLGARTGLSPLVSFSNINTMLADTREVLASLLRAGARGAADDALCARLREVTDSYASAQFNYERALRIMKSGDEALRQLGYSRALLPRSSASPRFSIKANGLEGEPETYPDERQRFAVVISPDTLDWLDHPLHPSYFPAQRSVSEVADAVFAGGRRGALIGNAAVLDVSCK